MHILCGEKIKNALKEQYEGYIVKYSKIRTAKCGHLVCICYEIFGYIFSFHMPPALIWAQDNAHSTQR